MNKELNGGLGKKRVIVYVITLILLAIFVKPPLSNAEQGIGAIEINIKYANGDTADYSIIAVKVYQDLNTIPFKEIDSLNDNPYNIVALPLGHTYKIDVYGNGMYATEGYVDLESQQQQLDLNIPLPGGARFHVFYNDGSTKIQNATLTLKSQDGRQQGAQSKTNGVGTTIRYWVQPNITPSNYYITEIDIAKNINYSYSPVNIVPGESQEINIVTTWPAIINNILTVRLYDTASKVVVPSEKNFLVGVYDDSGNKVAESKTNVKGEAYFSDFKVGNYVFRAFNTTSSDLVEWGNATVALTGNQTTIKIFKYLHAVNEGSAPPVIQKTPQNITQNVPQNITHTPQNCNCVVFRLDNIQDYWLNNIQMKVIQTFQDKNASLSIGIISKAFGNDPKLTSFIKEKIKGNHPEIEVANNGWAFEDFSSYSKDEQKLLLKESNERISLLSGISPIIFIPPYGKINTDTFGAMLENNMTYLSINTLTYQTISYNTTIHRIPATVSTGYASTGNGTLQRITNDEVLTNIENSLNHYGFAVVTMNIQDYGSRNSTQVENVADTQQIQGLESLIDNIRNHGLKIITLEEINGAKPSASILVPTWIKNNAGWWASGQIGDSDFIKGIQYMISQGIMKIGQTSSSNSTSSQQIPVWVKNNAGWWASGQIGDSDFIKGIQYLVQQEIIRVS